MGHALRGAVSAWLGLIVLQTIVTHTDRAGGALDVLNGLVQRALDPNVPAIPDRRPGAAAAAAGAPYGPNMTPAQLDAVVRAANAAPAVGKAFGPGSSWANLPGADAYTALGSVDWQAVARNLPHS
jgi:hypothetical protein